MSLQRPTNDFRQVLVLLSPKFECPFDEFVYCLRRNMFGAENIPDQLIAFIATWLVISADPVKQDQVKAVRASSYTDWEGDIFPLDTVLLNNEEYWMSGEDTMPEGKGEEYIEFQLAPDMWNSRKLTAISLKIPENTTNHPLLVYDFRVDYQDCYGTWIQGGQVYTLGPGGHLSSRGLPFAEPAPGSIQRFAFEDPIYAKKIRLVCISNRVSFDRMMVDFMMYESEHAVVWLTSIASVLVSYVKFD